MRFLESLLIHVGHIQCMSIAICTLKSNVFQVNKVVTVIKELINLRYDIEFVASIHKV